MRFRKQRENPAQDRQLNKLRWGPVHIDATEATGHFAAIGASGSGKTTILRLLMQSALSKVGIASDCRALIYDAKQDVLPLLAAICPHARVVASHPFDARSARWDMGRDIKEPTVAIEVAFTLIPQDGDSQPFFANAARHLLYGVMLSFVLTGKPWTFGTLIRAMKNIKRIRSILRRHPQTRPIVAQYFGDERLLMNIMSTLATKLLPFEPIAAAWDHATTSFSLTDWVIGDWILVLGNYETGRTAIDAINRCIFKRASDLMLNLPNSDTRRSWCILDELADVGGVGGGGLPGLNSLAKKGRSKGAVLVISYQSVSSLRDPKSFGQYQTDEILGQIANRFFGRLECVATAEWASSLFGDEEVERESYSKSEGSSGATHSVNRQATTRRLVMPGELMSLEACNRENGLSGYYIVRSTGAFSDNIPGDELFGSDLVPPQADVAEFEPRPSVEQFLQPWSLEESQRYGAKPVAKPKNESTPTSPIQPPESQPPSQDVWNDLDASFS